MTDTTDLYWNPDWDEDEAAEIDEQDPDPTLGLAPVPDVDDTQEVPGNGDVCDQ